MPRLRLASWNCAMALHDKHARLQALAPDIAIIPECAEPDILRRKSPDFRFSDVEWHGENRDKGLGVFSFGEWRLRRHQSFDDRFYIALPIEVSGPGRLNLLALWAFYDRARGVAPNPPSLAEAIDHYSPFLSRRPAAVAGDFNSSVIWDAKGPWAAFGEVNRRLNDLGLESAYHTRTGEALGRETVSTLHFQKKATPVYHIDYIYAEPLLLGECTVGASPDWLPLSDHMPVVADLTLA